MTSSPSVRFSLKCKTSVREKLSLPQAAEQTARTERALGEAWLQERLPVFESDGGTRGCSDDDIIVVPINS